ncbi:molybdenum cofactor guanylyltransferase MobA [Prosthecomicrobium sp. N25]|uniref:molybdenum cofactor guanylyltransferase MobA n=1 Tax=Prosthecomicrobium sp. N25 TaxID=3129254 RepID=UPI003076921F
MSEIVGVILAGGLSRRMGGGDKPLLALGGRPMLAHVVERFRPQVDALVLNANGDPSRFGVTDLPVVPDTLPGHPGPLAGVLAGMRWAETHRPGARWVATAAGDTPFLPLDVVRCLAAALEGRPEEAIAIPSSESGTHQVFGLFPVSLADELEEGLLSGEARKVMAWIERHPTAVVPFASEGGVDPFFNANTPEDLSRAEALASSSSPKATI